MTREEAINRWADITEAVFWAEERIAMEWDAKLKEAVNKPKDEQYALSKEYCRAVATEIVSKISDEELAELEC